jgi:RNA polymerase sigma-70 factor, ECF subfamily
MTATASVTDFIEAQPQSGLLAAARAGDRTALGSLLMTVERPVYRFVYRLLGNAAAAEDVTQETLLKVCQNLNRYSERGQFQAWVYRIAANQARDARRRGRTWNELADTAFVEPDPERDEQLRLIMTSLRVLNDKERDALVLIDIEGYDSREAGRILGCLSITARTRATQARKKMRLELSRYYPELGASNER